MHALPQFAFDLLELGHHAIATGLPLEEEVPAARCAAEERKAQEVEGFRFAEPAPLSIGRPLLMPPGVPAERVAAMRQALAETFVDPEFLAEGDKIGLSLNDPRSGAELLRVIERAYAMPAEIVARLRKFNAIQ